VKIDAGGADIILDTSGDIIMDFGATSLAFRDVGVGTVGATIWGYARVDVS
jgi:hypothetical protein